MRIPAGTSFRRTLWWTPAIGFSTFAPEAGADLFLSQERDDLLFFQGHPEYEPDTLGREYRRDVRRFLAGGAEYPKLPKNYFGPDECELLARFREKAIEERDESLDGIPFR